jgi:hypothetical protein
LKESDKICYKIFNSDNNINDNNNNNNDNDNDNDNDNYNDNDNNREGKNINEVLKNLEFKTEYTIV